MTVPARIRTILEDYRADRSPIVADPIRLETTARPLRRLLGARSVIELSREVFRGYSASRQAEGVKPQTVRRELITLRAALRLAWREGRLSAVPAIPMPPPGLPRQRVLGASEIRRLLAAASGDDRLTIFIALAVATGARRTAILELTWDRVDFAIGTLDFRAPHPRAARRKNRAVVPIARPLLGRLRSFRRARAEDKWVVGLSAYQVARRFRKAAEAAGLSGVTPHVLRHTAATTLLRNVPLVMASRMLGHRSVAITEQVYGHLTVGDLSAAARTLGKMLEARS